MKERSADCHRRLRRPTFHSLDRIPRAVIWDLGGCGIVTIPTHDTKQRVGG